MLENIRKNMNVVDFRGTYLHPRMISSVFVDLRNDENINEAKKFYVYFFASNEK